MLGTALVSSSSAGCPFRAGNLPRSAVGWQGETPLDVGVRQSCVFAAFTIRSQLSRGHPGRAGARFDTAIGQR
jgi:hypothetical protein